MDATRDGTLAVCPGSYDPITLGHVDVVRRARGLFDEVVVAVAHNPDKRYLLDLDERLALARSATAVVKGLRGAADFDAEHSMALMNRHLSGVETVFVMGDPALAHVASSLVKDVARHGGPVEDLVTADVAAALRRVLPAPPVPGGTR